MTAIIETELPDFKIEAVPTLQTKLTQIIGEANRINVTNEVTFRQITALYAESKNWEKQIEFIRKQANQPDQERINARNDKAKELLMPLRQIQGIAKQKADGYQQMLEELKRQEEIKLIQVADILGLEDVPVPAAIEKSVRGDGAIMYMRTVRKFRIVDPEKVPDKYFVLDEALIEQDLKLGIAEIPGVEVYEQKETQLKTR